MLEATSEYIEDPKNILAKNELGKTLRMNMKLTLAYKGSQKEPGSFKNI